MRLSLAQAAGTVGRSRSTILRSIRAGKLSAERDELTGAWSIDAAELTRLFSVQANGHDQVSNVHGHDQIRTEGTDILAVQLAAAEARVADKDARIADRDDQLADLRRRLDRAEDERRDLLTALNTAQAQVRLLTDQRPNGGAQAPDTPRTRWRRLLAWRRWLA